MRARRCRTPDPSGRADPDSRRARRLGRRPAPARHRCWRSWSARHDALPSASSGSAENRPLETEPHRESKSPPPLPIARFHLRVRELRAVLLGDSGTPAAPTKRARSWAPLPGTAPAAQPHLEPQPNKRLNPRAACRRPWFGTIHQAGQAVRSPSSSDRYLLRLRLTKGEPSGLTRDDQLLVGRHDERQ
jgi:hypothetical protein